MEPTTERDGLCFCCGKDNPRGIHLEFEYPSPGEATSSLLVPDWFAGWKGITHGGFLSMLLDEVMAHACLGLVGGIVAGSDEAPGAVTGDITVRFKKPVPTGSRVRIQAKVAEVKGRMLLTEGRVELEGGVIAAEGTARFVRTGPSRAR